MRATLDQRHAVTWLTSQPHDFNVTPPSGLLADCIDKETAMNDLIQFGNVVEDTKFTPWPGGPFLDPENFTGTIQPS